MDIAMIGLGRMGANMAQRLHRGGHRVVGYDPGEGARQRAAEAAWRWLIRWPPPWPRCRCRAWCG